jgi:hypothetical protein
MSFGFDGCPGRLQRNLGSGGEAGSENYGARNTMKTNDAYDSMVQVPDIP